MNYFAVDEFKKHHKTMPTGKQAGPRGGGAVTTFGTPIDNDDDLPGEKYALC